MSICIQNNGCYFNSLFSTWKMNEYRDFSHINVNVDIPYDYIPLDKKEYGDYKMTTDYIFLVYDYGYDYSSKIFTFVPYCHSFKQNAEMAGYHFPDDMRIKDFLFVCAHKDCFGKIKVNEQKKEFNELAKDSPILNLDID